VAPLVAPLNGLVGIGRLVAAAQGRPLGPTRDRGARREVNAMNDRWLIMMGVLLVIALAAWAAVVWIALH
jgi:hypothetical protein